MTTILENVAGAAFTLFVIRLAFTGLTWADAKRTYRVLRSTARG